MKILMVTSFYPPYHIGGADTHVYHLSNALAQEGHKITVLSLIDSYFLKSRKKPKHDAYKNHKNVKVIFIKSKIGRLKPIFSYIFGVSASDRIRRMIEGDFDIVHFHNISLFGPKILTYKAKKKIMTIHDHWFICQMNGLFDGKECPVRNIIGKMNLKNQILHCIPHSIRSSRPLQLWRYTKMLPESLDCVDTFITPSNYMKERMSAGGLDAIKIKVIPNFLKHDASKKSFARSNYYLFVGRLEENKGISKLVEVFNELEDKLIIVGNGELEDKLKIIAKPNITFIGWKDNDELEKIYSEAKATIVPSLSPDNFPTVALESLSCGTPVIGTRIGGIPEIIVKFDPCLMFDPHDFGNLKTIIADFNDASYRRDKLKAIINDNFSKANYLKRYGELL